MFTLEFLARKEHVIFVGPVGVGKTLLAQCLGSTSVRAGHSVVFIRADALLAELGQARADRTYDKVFRRYMAPDLVILDDFGPLRLNTQQSNDLVGRAPPARPVDGMYMPSFTGGDSTARRTWSPTDLEKVKCPTIRRVRRSCERSGLSSIATLGSRERLLVSGSGVSDRAGLQHR